METQEMISLSRINSTVRLCVTVAGKTGKYLCVLLYHAYKNLYSARIRRLFLSLSVSLLMLRSVGHTAFVFSRKEKVAGRKCASPP